MPCDVVEFGGGRVVMCGPELYEFTRNGRKHLMEYHSMCGGPSFVTQAGDPYVRQPFQGVLASVADRLVWRIPDDERRAWKPGEKRTDGYTGIVVERLR